VSAKRDPAQSTRLRPPTKNELKAQRNEAYRKLDFYKIELLRLRAEVADLRAGLARVLDTIAYLRAKYNDGSYPPGAYITVERPATGTEEP